MCQLFSPILFFEFLISNVLQVMCYNLIMGYILWAKGHWTHLNMNIRTLQFSEDILGSKPDQGFIARVSKLHGCVKSKLHLVYPVHSEKEWRMNIYNNGITHSTKGWHKYIVDPWLSTHLRLKRSPTRVGYQKTDFSINFNTTCCQKRLSNSLTLASLYIHIH